MSDATAASRGQAAGLSAVLVLMMLLVLYLMLAVWPHPTPSTEPATAPTASTGTKPSPADSLHRATSPARDSTRTVDSTRDTATLTLDSTRSADTTRTASARRARDTSNARGGRIGATTGDSTGATRAETGCRKRLNEERAGSTKPAPAGCASIFGREVFLWDEQRLLALVMLGGALGSLLYALRSLGWYIGNRKLVTSWIARYLFLSLTGAALAFVFYVVIRGGFFSPNTGFESTSPYGFVAFATLVGLFSEQAVLKLKEVAETLLAKPAPGRDAAPQHTSGSTQLQITDITVEKDASQNPTGNFVVNGLGFVSQSQVAVNGAVVPSTFVSDTELRFKINPTPASGTALKVEVRNPGNQTVSKDVTV